MERHKSDSSEQQQAEKHILHALETAIGAKFKTDAAINRDIGVEPDGIDQDKKVVVEAYAHVGELKGAQLHKVKADLLKLIFIGHQLGEGWRKIMCFSNKEAARYLQGKSWAARAASEFNVEVIVQELPEDHQGRVKAAQQRQRMVNA
jgi:hypothetical protein